MPVSTTYGIKKKFVIDTIARNPTITNERIREMWKKSGHTDYLSLQYISTIRHQKDTAKPPTPKQIPRKGAKKEFIFNEVRKNPDTTTKEIVKRWSEAGNPMPLDPHYTKDVRRRAILDLKTNRTEANGQSIKETINEPSGYLPAPPMLANQAPPLPSVTLTSNMLVSIEETLDDLIHACREIDDLADVETTLRTARRTIIKMQD